MNREEKVARALAAHERALFGEMTLTDLDGSDPKVIDTRPSYLREAKRYIAMFDALTDGPQAHGKPPSDAPSEQNPSSQPTQTGEENAGLVELIIQHLSSYTGPREDDGPAGGEDFCAYLTYDGLDRLAAALASRSPIPGELKALSDAATDELIANEIDRAWRKWTGRTVGDVHLGGSSLDGANYIARHVRQALAKTQAAEGGEGG